MTIDELMEVLVRDELSLRVRAWLAASESLLRLQSAPEWDQIRQAPEGEALYDKIMDCVLILAPVTSGLFSGDEQEMRRGLDFAWRMASRSVLAPSG